MTPRTSPLLRRILVGVLLVAALAVVIWLISGAIGPARMDRRPISKPSADGPRIVSLSPALSIILRDLGGASRMVGRDANDMVLDRRLPVCGDLQSVDYETVLGVHPTHILLQQSEAPPRLRELAAAHGWTIRTFPNLLTLDDIERTTVDLASIVGVSPTDLVRAMHTAWSRRDDGFARAGRVLLLDSTDPPATLGPGSFHQQILERLGGTPAITDGGRYMTLDLEEIRRLAPDAIILFRPRDAGSPARPSPPTADQALALLGRIGTLDIPAVRRRCVALIDDPLCLTPSTAMIGIADQLADILARWSSQP